jgi:hypothetical protein
VTVLRSLAGKSSFSPVPSLLAPSALVLLLLLLLFLLLLLLPLL